MTTIGARLLDMKVDLLPVRARPSKYEIRKFEPEQPVPGHRARLREASQAVHDGHQDVLGATTERVNDLRRFRSRLVYDFEPSGYLVLVLRRHVQSEFGTADLDFGTTNLNFGTTNLNFEKPCRNLETVDRNLETTCRKSGQNTLSCCVTSC